MSFHDRKKTVKNIDWVCLLFDGWPSCHTRHIDLYLSLAFDDPMVCQCLTCTLFSIHLFQNRLTDAAARNTALASLKQWEENYYVSSFVHVYNTDSRAVEHLPPDL